MERDAHLQSLFYITFICLSKSPVHEPPSRFLSSVSMKRDAQMPVTRAFLYITFRVPNKGNSPSRFTSQSTHRERCSDSRALLQLSLRVSNEQTPLIIQLSLEVSSK
jgi:hypothetical protein